MKTWSVCTFLTQIQLIFVCIFSKNYLSETNWNLEMSSCVDQHFLALTLKNPIRYLHKSHNTVNLWGLFALKQWISCSLEHDTIPRVNNLYCFYVKNSPPPKKKQIALWYCASCELGDWCIERILFILVNPTCQVQVTTIIGNYSTLLSVICQFSLLTMFIFCC